MRESILKYTSTLFLLLSFTFFCIWNAYFANQGQTNPESISEYTYIFVLALVAYLGVRISYKKLLRYFPHLKGPTVVLLSFFAGIISFTAAVLLHYPLVRRLFWDLDTTIIESITQVPFSVMSVYLPVSLVSLLLMHQTYISRLKIAISEKEKIMQQQELQFLRRQLDHHFLFNNLNFLVHLTESKDERAAIFIQKMADVYRYATKHATEELVSLTEEIAFAQSYLDVMNFRFNNSYTLALVNFSLLSLNLLYILPGTLQLLMENVIKHNESGKEEGLAINIIIHADQSLTVENVIVAKKYKQSGLGIGLQNLSAIYKLSWGKTVEVTSSNGNFKVTVPLILNAYEDSSN